MIETPTPPKPVELFYSYSHKDERLRDKLETHLSILKQSGFVVGWHDRKVSPGAEWKQQIDYHLDTADIILLLVSADFLASEYCYGIEVKRALQRHDSGDACVIPVILRAVDWKAAPFAHIESLPKDGKPITSWSNQDEAFKNVAQGIQRAILDLKRGGLLSPSRSAKPSETPTLSSLAHDRCQWILVLRATVRDMNRQRVDSILRQLQELSNDSTVSLRRIEQGSARLVLEGSFRGFLQIQALFMRGSIQAIDGIAVEDIYQAVSVRALIDDVSLPPQSEPDRAPHEPLPHPVDPRREQLHAALLDAFDRAALERMVDFGLNESLDIIAGTGPLADVVHRLILWAERQGRAQDLLSAALDARFGNPNNPLLRAYSAAHKAH